MRLYVVLGWCIGTLAAISLAYGYRAPALASVALGGLCSALGALIGLLLAR